MMGRLVEIKVWKEIVASLFVCLTLSVGKGYAQSESMVSSTDNVPLLERMTDGKRKVDWADIYRRGSVLLWICPVFLGSY